jgi:hypothetical protein
MGEDRAGGERRFWLLIGGPRVTMFAANRPLLPRKPRGGGGATGEGCGIDTGRTTCPEEGIATVLVEGIGRCLGRPTAVSVSRVGVVTSIAANGLG